MALLRPLFLPAVLFAILVPGNARGEDSPVKEATTKDATLFGVGPQQLLRTLQGWNKAGVTLATSPLVRDADNLASKGDYKGAVDLYSLALQAEESRETRYRRAYTLAILKKYDQAIEDCTANLIADPKDFESQYMRAWCQTTVGRLSEAARDYEALAAAQPKNFRHSYALGSLRAGEKEYEKANEWFAKAIQIEPREPESYLARCKCLLYLKQHDQAVGQITALLKCVPQQAGGYVRTHSFARDLSAEDLDHGRKQMEQLLKDRPEMAVGLAPEDPLYQWAMRKFAGEDLPERINWNSTFPTGGEADHGAPVAGEPGMVRVASRKRGLLGLLPGRKLTFDEHWSHLCFELHNIQGSPAFEQSNRLAARRELTRDGYIRQCAYHEYLALLRTRAFYVDVYFPRARSKKVETVPEQWRLDLPPTFESWLGQYTDHANYPWEPYGSYYDGLVGQKDLGLELEAQRTEPKAEK